MPETSISQLAYYLALIGGIIMVILGALSLFGYPFGPLHWWGFAYGSIVTIICGVIAVIGARRASTLVWAIVLIIVGLIGGTLGGLLVLIGGIIGLVTVLSKKH